MSLKENIEQGRQELSQREQEKKELERREEQYRIESFKNKVLLLHEKALGLFKPYKSFIESSQCIPILEELVQIEKLTSKKDGHWPKEAAVPRIYVSFTYNKGHYNLNLKISITDNFLKLGEQKDEEILKCDFLDDRGWENKIAIPDFLNIKECSLSLEWERYDYTTSVWTNYEEGESTEYDVKDSKLIKIFFTPSSLQIFGKEKGEILTRRNINKNSLEKSISRAYLNPVINKGV